MQVCIFGDSITWGANDNERGGWAERLKTFYLGERDIDVYNLGIPGDKTEDLLKRFDAEASVRDADVVVFAAGINDSQYVGSKNNPRVPLEQFKNNFVELIAKAKKLTNKIIIVGLTSVDESKTSPVSWAPTKYYDNESVGRYNDVLKQLAAQEQILFVDVQGIVDNKDLDDGLHPDAKGHQKMFESIKPVVERLLS